MPAPARAEGWDDVWAGGGPGDRARNTLEAPRHCRPEDLAAVVVGPELDDVRAWGAQGVLVLEGGAGEGGHPGARAFEALCWRLPPGTSLPVLLWGEPAGLLAAEVKARGHIAVVVPAGVGPAASQLLEGGQAQLRLVNQHLQEAGRRPLCWNPAAAVLVFTDGAASNNGKAAVRAGFSAVFLGGPFGGTLSGCTAVSGPVLGREYALLDPADPARGLAVTAAAATPSNNRGELLGLIYGLLGALRGRVRGRVEVVSDSLISIRTMREWLPARLRAGTAHKLKNLDLIMVAWRLLEALRREAAHVELTHMRGHQPEPAAGDRRARTLWAGNRLADSYATSAGPAVVAHRAPPALQGMCG